MTIYKSFVSPHLDYADIVYDQTNNVNFCQEIENMQYDSPLVVT